MFKTEKEDFINFVEKMNDQYPIVNDFSDSLMNIGSYGFSEDFDFIFTSYCKQNNMSIPNRDMKEYHSLYSEYRKAFNLEDEDYISEKLQEVNAALNGASIVNSYKEKYGSNYRIILESLKKEYEHQLDAFGWAV